MKLVVYIKRNYSDINFIILDNLNNPWIFDDFQTIAIIIFISILGSFGIISLIAAYRIGSAIVNAPTEYIHLLFSVVIGYFIFTEIPDIYSFIGILLIVTSGCYIVYRENKRESLVVAKTTLRT